MTLRYLLPSRSRISNGAYASHPRNAAAKRWIERPVSTALGSKWSGYWPLEIDVRGLAPRTGERPFELWLTRGGKPTALCGIFLTNADGSAVVQMNAPYRFDGDYGWIVVEKGSSAPLLTT